LPSPFDTDPRLAGFRAGYVCEVIGVVWTYFDIEGCRPAAIHGTTFDDATKPLVAAIEARYPGPSISFWEAHGWKLLAAGFVLLPFALIVWRRRSKALQRAAMAKRHTRFHLSAIDPSVADNHVAAWERGQGFTPAGSAVPAAWEPGQGLTPAESGVAVVGSPSRGWTPVAQAQPQGYPAQPAAVAYHGYGPYGRVTALHKQAPPHPAITLPYAPPAPANDRVPVSSEPPCMPPAPPSPSPSWAVAGAHDITSTVPDASYQALIEREHAIQLARGSQSDELENTRQWLAIQPNQVNPPEPPALRATRLRHPPVPKPPQLAMLLHIPNRLS
jgi:hypothetical protein